MKEKEPTSAQQVVKFSHKKWKALLKKQKRKILRQNDAIVRDKEKEEEEKKKEQSPTFQAKEREKKKLEELEEQRLKAEKVYFNKLWMERERIAQLEFERKKQREEKEKIRRAEVERKIKEEWEETQKKEKEQQEKEAEKKKHQDSLLQQATANENKDGEEPWHNPIASYLPGKEKETCPFFAKTGACRFGERCSRGHPLPEASTTLMIRGMYNHFELEQGLLDENDSDLILEYEDREIYNNFREFYDDIVPEFKAAGQVIQVKVCCNYEPHLRGNVYIQYSSEEDANAAMFKMNGRFYGGKQISCEPVEIKSWKSAICGLFGKGRCPKGRNCNFLHVFKNPRNEFWEYDKPQWKNNNRVPQSQRSFRHSRSRSRSPHDRRSNGRHSYSRDRSDYRSRSRYTSRSHRFSRSRSKERYSRPRSRERLRSKERYSRPRSRERSKSQERYSRPRSRERSKSRERYSRPRSRERYSRSKSRNRSRTRSPSRKRKRSSRKQRYSKSPTEKYSRSRSRSSSYSRNRTKSRSPSVVKMKKKKHKHKKHKKGTKSHKSKHETIDRTEETLILIGETKTSDEEQQLDIDNESDES